VESLNYYRIISLLLFVNRNGIWIWATPNIIIHMSQYCRLTRIADNWSAFSPRLRFLLKYRTTTNRPSNGLYKHHVWFLVMQSHFPGKSYRCYCNIDTSVLQTELC